MSEAASAVSPRATRASRAALDSCVHAHHVAASLINRFISHTASRMPVNSARATMA